jgi:PAS domain S-box-containing protein
MRNKQQFKQNRDKTILQRILALPGKLRHTYVYKLSCACVIMLILTVGAVQAQTGQLTEYELMKLYVGYNLTVGTLLMIIFLLILLHIQESKNLKKYAHKNSQLNIALKSADMGLWEWNIDTEDCTVDERCAEMLGYTLDEVVPHSAWWLDKIHEDDRKDAKEQLMDLFSGTIKTFRIKYRIQKKSGEWIWVRDCAQIHEYTDSGKPLTAIGTHVDITDVHKDKDNINQLATVVKQASETIIITNSKGIIEYVNPSFESKMGYSAKDVIGSSPKMFQSGEHSNEFYQNMRNDLDHSRVWHGMLVNKAKDGSIIKLETTISPVKNNRGEIIQYIAIGRDSTHELQLEGQLRQAQKMEAIGTLAGGIAHDFNNILSAVIGYSELAILDTDPGTPAHRNMSEVFKAAKRAADLVSQILTFSRRTEHERKPLLLAPVIKETLKLLRGSLPSTIDIQQEISNDCPPILADPTQMHQVIMNLCTNAYHAMRETGGVLSVRLAETEITREKTIDQFTLAPGKYAHITISDTGVGIPPQIIDRIFDPYFTTKEGGDGTGLGLATVHGIIKIYDGSITVTSHPGEATAFDIMLPICDPQLYSTPSSKTKANLPKGSSELIMVVDDEEAIAQVVEIALRNIGYNVEAYTSSVKALEAFHAAPQRFSCIITDQTMPTLTGVDLAKLMMEDRPDIPIILCSGFSETINEEKALKMGICRYIMKPATFSTLAEAVRYAIAGNNDQ